MKVLLRGNRSALEIEDERKKERETWRVRRLLSREQQADRWISRDFVVVIDTRGLEPRRMNLHGDKFSV